MIASELYVISLQGGKTCVWGEHGLERVIHEYSESDSVGLCCSVLD